ncbi:unnamed protein product [Musa textilis]
MHSLYIYASSTQLMATHSHNKLFKVACHKGQACMVNLHLMHANIDIISSSKLHVIKVKHAWETCI